MSVPSPAPARRRLKKRYLLLAFVVFGLVFAVGPRTPVIEPDPARVLADVPTELRALPSWVAARERAAGVRDTAVQARVVFAGDTVRTPWAVVYLHGFSGTRLEADPVPSLVARALGANLHEVRLTGHGLDGAALASASAEAWMGDALRALAVGRRLGDSVVVIGLSTGGTLATWLAARRDSTGPRPDKVVLISPNFGPKDQRTKAALLPWAPVLLPKLIPTVVLGDTANRDPDIRRMSTKVFPVTAVLPMQGLVDHVLHMPLRSYTAPTLAIWNPEDPVVLSKATAAWLKGLEARKLVVEREELAPQPTENQHVITGRLLAPSTVDRVSDRVVRFVRGG
ncbi:MAG: alpha/beta hydrolase [Gemmatimonadaceae bacterium]|jgi:esterase/lipase|nr:alpha/beta hydrolase [Gemmatimonadaceae bacterium]